MWTGRHRLRNRNINESRSNRVLRFCSCSWIKILEVEYREMTSQIKQKMCHLIYSVLCHMSRTTCWPWMTGWALGTPRKTATTAFEVVCGWSVLRTLSFTMSQLSQAAASLSDICLSAVPSSWPAHLEWYSSPGVIHQLTWSDTHLDTWLGNYAPTLWKWWKMHWGYMWHRKVHCLYLQWLLPTLRDRCAILANVSQSVFVLWSYLEN